MLLIIWLIIHSNKQWVNWLDWHHWMSRVQTQPSKGGRFYSISNRKSINRIYWTPCKMSGLEFRNSDLCNWCDALRGTLLHKLYSFPMIDFPWSQRISFINTLISSTLIQQPMLCLLGIVPKGRCLNIHQISWCRNALISRCRILLRHWKTKEEILVREWFNYIAKISSYERLCYRLR